VFLGPTHHKKANQESSYFFRTSYMRAHSIRNMKKTPPVMSMFNNSRSPLEERFMTANVQFITRTITSKVQLDFGGALW